MSPLLKTLENEVQIAALLFMAAVYTIRLAWLFRFKSRKERTFAEGKEAAGIGRSLLNIAMPWAVESARKKPGVYLQFVIFHLGVAASDRGDVHHSVRAGCLRGHGRCPDLPGHNRRRVPCRVDEALQEAQKSGRPADQHGG